MRCRDALMGFAKAEPVRRLQTDHNELADRDELANHNELKSAARCFSQVRLVRPAHVATCVGAVPGTAGIVAIPGLSPMRLLSPLD